MLVNNGNPRFRCRGCISVFLAVAIVAANMGFGLFHVDTRAVEQAAGQLGYYSIYCETSAQDCDGVGTDADFKLRLEFDDGQVWYSNVLDDIADENDQEADDNNTMFISADNTDAGDDTSKWYAPAKPVTSVGVYQVTSNGGTWKWDTISVNYWAGSAWHQIATLGAGSFDTLEGTIDIPYNGYLDDNNRLLTFDGNGGTVNGEAAFQFYSEYGATLPEGNFPPDASRTGYTFTGWDPSSLPLLGPSADTSFSAQWSVNYYTITFDANGGSGGRSDSLAYGSVLTPPVVERAGYTFTGWSPSPPATVPAADTTFVAQWIDGSLVNITFNANGGTGGYGPVSMTKGAPLAAPVVSRTGYTFTHWLPEVPAAVPNVNTVYVACWSANSYLVSFDAQGGGVDPASTSVVFDQPYGQGTGGFPSPVREGYLFKGWHTQPEGSGMSINAETLVSLASDHTLYAKWSVIYTIQYDANNNEATGSMASSVHEVNLSKSLTPCGYSVIGWDFLGWSTIAEGTVMYADGEDVLNLSTEPGAVVTLYAHWAPHQYSVIYNGNGADDGVMEPTLQTYDTAGVLTANAYTKTGYTFLGWSYTSNGPVAFYDGAAVINLTQTEESVTLYAVWRANTYTVKYIGNTNTGGATADSQHTYDIAGALTQNGYTKTGYSFLGWGLTSASTQPEYADQAQVVNLTATDNGVVTFYAVWQVNSYQITFDANGGTGGWSESRQYGTALTLPTVTRTGYTFTGWSPAPPSVVPAANVAYTAQWQINDYRMTFNPNNGSETVSQLMPYNSALTAPVPTRPGYTFAEWMPAVPATVPAEDMEYTARWYKDGLSINLDLEAGRQDVVSGAFVPLAENETLTAGDIITVRIKPEADFLVGVTRYVVMFDKTVFSIIGENKDAFTPNTGNDFYAAVAPDYTATTNILDSAWPSTFGNDENYNSFKAVAVGNRANYTSANGGYPGYMLGNEWLFSFQLEVTGAPANGDHGRIWLDERWARDSSNPNGLSYFAKCLPGQRSSEGDSVSYDYQLDLSDADLQLPIQAIAVQSTIYFDENGGSTVLDISQLSGTQVTPPDDPVREGYTFTGWTPEVPVIMPVADCTCVAQWSVNSYTVTFDAAGGAGGWSQSLQYGTTLTPPTVTRTGYSFTAWSPTPPGTVPACDVTYTAQWTANTYYIIFNANGGSGSMINQAVYYGGLATLSACTFTRTGYTFTGWNTASNGSGTSYTPGSTFGPMPAYNVTLYAQWNVNTYYVDFNANGGSGSMLNQGIQYGSSAALTINAFTRNGYTFAGWNTAANGSGTSYANQSSCGPMGAGNVTLYAQWTANTYMVSFNANEGIAPSPMSKQVTYNSAYGTLATTSRTGYTFNGWYTASSGGTKIETTTIVSTASGHTLYAHWTANNYTITFDANGGTGGWSQSLQYGTLLTPPTVTKTGYTFSGWNPTPPGTVPAVDTVYVAQWSVESQEVTLSFNLNGGTGTVPGAQSGLPSNAVQLPAKGNISRQYYTFLGWAETMDATQALVNYNFPNADTTLYAVWQRVPVTLAIKAGSTTVFAAEAGVHYIYGLEEGLSEQAFRSNFAQINGDGRLQVTMIEGNFGTGTRVDLYDNVTNDLLLTYWIVIFGDVDGDGYVSAADENLIDAAASYQSEFEYGTAAFYAADIMQDGGVDALDLNIISAATSYTGIIDQVNPGALI